MCCLVSCLLPDKGNLINETTKQKTMALHKGKPSGINKPDIKGTGVSSNFTPENQERNSELTEKYTRDDEGLADGLKMQHPNRNPNKKNPTNAGRYRY